MCLMHQDGVEQLQTCTSPELLWPPERDQAAAVAEAIKGCLKRDMQ